MPSYKPAHQRGIGVSSVMFAILLVAFFLTLLFKLGPLYMNDRTLASILESVASEMPTIEGSPRAISNKIGSHMNINSLKEPALDVFRIAKVRDYTWEIEANYERRVHLFFNVDAVAKFQHKIEFVTK